MPHDLNNNDHVAIIVVIYTLVSTGWTKKKYEMKVKVEWHLRATIISNDLELPIF